MPRYVVIRQEVEAPQKKERVAGNGGNLELDYSLPVRHVVLSALFAGCGAQLFWFAAIIGAGIFAAVPGDWRLRLLPVLVLAPLPFFAVPAFRAAWAEWKEFTGLVKQSRWAQEIALGRDLDGDGSIGRPGIVINGAPPVPTKEQLDRMARDEFRAWILSLETGGTAYRNGDVKRSEYERRRERLMRAGWAEWVEPDNHRAGWVLTAPAAEVVASIG